jgi:uncharacterized phiE125 gp8 family phage protein
MKNVVTRSYQSTAYITVSDLKKHLRIVSNDDDMYIARLLDACFEYASNFVGFEIRKSTVDYFFEDTTDGKFHIPARVLSLTSVKYRDTNGDLQTMASTDYDEVLTISANYGYDVALINSAPTLYDYGWRYKITVVEGFGISSDTIDVSKMFPEDLRHAIYLFAEHLYTQRGSQAVGVNVAPLDWNHEHLLYKYAIREFV